MQHTIGIILQGSQRNNILAITITGEDNRVSYTFDGYIDEIDFKLSKYSLNTPLQI